MTKIVFKRKPFQNAVTHCNTVIDKKTTMPILNYILLEPRDGYCLLKATNLDTSVIMSIPCESLEGNDIIAFPSKYIHDVSKVITGEDILFSFDSDHLLLEVTSGRSLYKIPCSEPGDFPDIQTVEKTDLTCTVTKLIAPIGKLVFSTTDVRINKSYSGILLKNTEDGSLDMVSTDIHRISIVTLENMAFDNEAFNEGIVIPSDDFKRLATIFDKDEEVCLVIEDGKIHIMSENKTFISRLIKNDFPNYRKIVGSVDTIKEKDTAVINRVTFEDGLKRVVALIMEEKIWATKLSFQENILEMSANSEFGGASKDQVLVEEPFSRSYDIGINSRFILEVLGVMENSEIHISAEEGLKPFTFFEQTDELSYIHMVMPLRM